MIELDDPGGRVRQLLAQRGRLQNFTFGLVGQQGLDHVPGRFQVEDHPNPSVPVGLALFDLDHPGQTEASLRHPLQDPG